MLQEWGRDWKGEELGSRLEREGRSLSWRAEPTEKQGAERIERRAVSSGTLLPVRDRRKDKITFTTFTNILAVVASSEAGGRGVQYFVSWAV